MADCEYYREAINIVESDTPVLRAPWCAHPKHSRVNEWAAVATIGGEELLKCCGRRHFMGSDRRGSGAVIQCYAAHHEADGE